MRVLAAVRLSDDKDTSTSTETQHATVRAWSAARDHVVVGSAEDTDVSARKISPFKRPQLSKWLRAPLVDEWDILVCSKQDRLFRSVADIGAFTAWCIEHGKAWAAVAEGTDLSTPAGRMFANMLAAIGEFEADRAGERRAEAAERLAGYGQWDGGTYPFGYLPRCVCHGTPKCQNAPQTAGWTLVKGANAGTVHDMAMRSIAGDSNGKIARWLNAEGITTTRGFQWMPDVVGKLLRNPALSGYSVHRGKIVRDADGNNVMITADPILTDDDFRRLQAALDSRKQKRGERVGGHQLLRVAYCEDYSTADKLAPMYGHVRQGRSKTNIYRCERCKYSTNMARLEAQVEEWLMAAIGARMLPHKVVTPAISHTADLEKAERKIAEIDAAYDAGDLPIAAYSRQMTKWEAERARLADLPQRDADTRYVPTETPVWVHWASLDSAARGAFLRHWGFKVLVRHHGRTYPEVVDISDASITEAFGLAA